MVKIWRHHILEFPSFSFICKKLAAGAISRSKAPYFLRKTIYILKRNSQRQKCEVNFPTLMEISTLLKPNKQYKVEKNHKKHLKWNLVKNPLPWLPRTVFANIIKTLVVDFATFIFCFFNLLVCSTWFDPHRTKKWLYPCFNIY